jgi:hypothetical protein
MVERAGLARLEGAVGDDVNDRHVAAVEPQALERELRPRTDLQAQHAFIEGGALCLVARHDRPVVQSLDACCHVYRPLPGVLAARPPDASWGPWHTACFVSTLSVMNFHVTVKRHTGISGLPVASEHRCIESSRRTSSQSSH